MNINPQSTLRIVRQLSDPTDSSTYYVQAVVRNSASGATLQTVNLTDEGSQRFTGSYHTPADVSGNGFYLDITTTVYTDSGYSTVSTDYSVDTQTYHVQQAWNHAAGLGGGVEVNYDKVRSIIKEELGKLDIPSPVDATPAVMDVERRLREAIVGAVSSISIPEQVQPDLDRVVRELKTTIEDAVNTMLIAVDNKEVTPAPDFTPVIAEVRKIPVQKILETTNNLRQLVTQLEYFKKMQDETDALREATEEFMTRINPEKRQEQVENMGQQRALRARNLLGI